MFKWSEVLTPSCYPAFQRRLLSQPPQSISYITQRFEMFEALVARTPHESNFGRLPDEKGVEDGTIVGEYVQR
jgi:hypothetical protein